MSRQDGGSDLSLSFSNGRPALAVARRELAALASLERLEMEVPNLRAPLDLGATADRFRNRRCRLQAAVVTVDEARLAAAVSPGALAQAGIADLRLALGDGHVLLRARAAAGDRQAEFTARAVLSPAAARRVRLAIEDVRVYGFLPLPAPLLGGAILNATSAGGGGGATARATARWTVEIDALDLALYETFAASGWRLPDVSAARLRNVTVSPEGIRLDWAADALHRPGEAEEITATGTPPPFEEAEGLLARGDFAGALAGYRSAAQAGGDRRPAARGHASSARMAERRVLELLLASPGALGEAEAQAARMAERWPNLPVVALARAVAAAERSDAPAAAEAYAEVGALAAEAGDHEDAALARMAAAREWLRAGQTEAARPLLEAVLAARPDDAQAAELLARSTSEPRQGSAPPATGSSGQSPPAPTRSSSSEPWQGSAHPATGSSGQSPPAPTRSSSSEPAPAAGPGVTQEVTALAVALLEAEQAEASDEFEAAAAALRRAIDLVKGRDERAGLARRLAAMCERQGDEEGALTALRAYLDAAPAGAGAGLQVAESWRRLVELHARRGDPHAAARALMDSADDGRTGWGEQERAAALVAAAEILRKRVGLSGDAVMLLERAIGLDPHSAEALEALEAIALESGDWERLGDVLERKIDVVARGPVEQKHLLVRLADVHDQHLGRADRARDTHERALQIDPSFRASLIWLGRDAWVRGDAAAAAALYGRLADGEDSEPPATPAEREEIHLRLGGLARRAGDDGTAERELERALASVPESAAALDQLLELYEAQARHAELADALGRRAAADLSPGARGDLLRRRAAALERAGQVAQAAALWRQLAESDPAALPALERLMERVRDGGDPAALASVLEPLGEALAAKGELEAADRVLAARVELAPDDGAAAALTTERARLRLLGPGGATSALAVLREVPLSALPEEGLVLRADLGERQRSLEDALPALDELLSRTRAAGQIFAAQEIEARIAELTGRSKQHAASVDDLEQALSTDPTDAAAAEELAGLYDRIADPQHRADALSGLLRRALGLSPDRRKAMYAALGASAEATGDLERAEQAYWRAATIEAEPALRANYLVAHARVLLARGEVQTAISELEEAIARVSHHAGALAVLADLTFRTQDWPRARQLYAELEAAPDAADVIARELLVHRRAVLAEAQGDSADAEAFYRELAILNPRHAEARRALADIALRRGDFGAAALRLEEVLRLLPLEALDQLLDVRQRLGAVYVQVGDWGSARYYLELVMAQDPSRVPALEMLVEVYERLELFKEAAAACARLSRLYFEPSRRAGILYRQGELLRTHLGDEASAFDAFLKSSDLDPRFVPTMVRLTRYFWPQGDWQGLAEMAADLAAAGFSPGDDAEIATRLAIGTALAGQPRWVIKASRFDAEEAARTLAEAGLHLGRRPPADLDAALGPILEWAGGADATAGSPIEAALAALVGEDPAHTGALRVLGRLADRDGRSDLARAAYALLVFLEPEDSAAERLAGLSAAAPAPAEALRIGGAADHAGLPGSLRRALAALAAPLLGFGADGPAPAPAAGRPLPAPQAAELVRLGEALGAPPFVAEVEPTTTAGIAITVVPTRPAALRVTAAAADLPERAWRFCAARALEELRGGMASVRALLPDEARALLVGALAALTGGAPEAERARAVARWLADAEAAAALPAGPDRQRLIDDLRAALGGAPDWAAFLEAAQDTANRVGLLACGSPAEALAALAREDVLLAQADPGGADARRGFLRTSAVRELARFMVSPAYARALAAPRAGGRS